MAAVIADDFHSLLCDPWNPKLQYEYERRSFRDYAYSIYDPNNKCFNCDERSAICLCGSPGQPPFLSLRWDINFSRTGNSDAALPAQRQEMESSTGAGTVTATSLSEDPYTECQGGRMTLSGNAAVEETGLEAMNEQPILLDTAPNDSRYTDATHDSYMRGTAAGDDIVEADDEAARTLNSLATWPTSAAGKEKALPAFGHTIPETSLDYLQSALQLDHQNGHATLVGGTASYEVPAQYVTEAQFDPKNAKAYAKLVFADGDLFITTHDVMVGRNMERFEQMRRRKKQEKRAREELDTYRKEPSQPSQPGDGDQQGDPSNSSQSLEGRPAPPSNFSEHGGPVWYPPHSDGEVEATRKPRRRISHFSKSSSTTSVAPANLHTSSISDFSNSNNEPDIRTFAFIPIHTPAAEDIGKISKEHLMFSFDFQNEQWELKVVGNRAFINEELFEKGTVVPLRHNDEILIATVHMVFKLPDNFRQSPGLSRGTFSKDSEDEDVSDEDGDEDDHAISTSPVRRLSNALDVDEEESEQEPQAQVKGVRKKPKAKLQSQAKKTKLKGKSASGKSVPNTSEGKKPARKDSQGDESPKAAKKAEKGKKPRNDNNDEAAEDVKIERESTPTVPFIKPGSALEGIPIEDLPDKRKGPGRPPKEGNVSKRDMGFAKKKLKEYEKRGEEPPPFREIVTMVRRENKIKEMQAKMLANGQLEPGADVVASIEPEAGSSTTRAPTFTNDASNVAPTESARRSPPRPKRAVRALSPVKPEEECTEEDLKKPDRTYVHILDEVLQGNSGPADLPEIYERMQKRHPYFKYKCKTLGWQSSVRHNLQQSLRFKEVGKAGKGKLWSVDTDVPMEKEKKRKTTPPKQVMHNGQFLPGQMPHPQYGSAAYGNPYGPHQPNGQPQPGMPAGNVAYYSPYSQQYGGHPPPNGMQHSQTYPGNQQPFQHQVNGASIPQQEQLPQHMNKIVEELVKFHSRHTAQYNGNAPEQERQRKLLHNVMEYLSSHFHDKEPDPAIADAVRSEAHRPLYEQLDQVFKRHRPDFAAPSPFLSEAREAAQDDPVVGATTHAPPNDANEEGIDSKHQSPLTAQEPSYTAPDVQPPAGSAEVEGLGPTTTPAVLNSLKRAAEEDASGLEAKRQRMTDT